LVIKISVREDESLESVLKRFKRICDKEGIKKALKQYSYYEKPSERRRRKEKAARFAAMLSARYAEM